MKVLWIVNSVLNELSLALYGKSGNGVWMDALLSDFKGKENYEIVVATAVKTKKPVRIAVDNVTYYALPDNVPLLYKENKKKNIAVWQKLLQGEKPDLIQVWGTEFTHGLCALRQAKNIPSVIYMQGFIKSIARFYQAGIPYKALKRTVTLRDLLKRDSILSQQKKYYKQAKKEKEMLKLAGRIISENEWCNSNIRAIVPDIEVYDCPLSINKVFSEKRWEFKNIEKYSLICTAPGYTIKGFHILLNALALLKNKYPRIKLYVPGNPQVKGKTFREFIHKDGYSKYIEKLVKKLCIKDNIVWLGELSQEELANEYSKKHVFVMPSAIENHSSSLKEAMMVGTPWAALNALMLSASCTNSSLSGVMMMYSQPVSRFS